MYCARHPRAVKPSITHFLPPPELLGILVPQRRHKDIAKASPKRRRSQLAECTTQKPLRASTRQRLPSVVQIHATSRLRGLARLNGYSMGAIVRDTGHSHDRALVHLQTTKTRTPTHRLLDASRVTNFLRLSKRYCHYCGHSQHPQPDANPASWEQATLACASYQWLFDRFFD